MTSYLVATLGLILFLNTSCLQKNISSSTASESEKTQITSQLLFNYEMLLITPKTSLKAGQKIQSSL